MKHKCESAVGLRSNRRTKVLDRKETGGSFLDAGPHQDRRVRKRPPTRKVIKHELGFGLRIPYAYGGQSYLVVRSYHPILIDHAYTTLIVTAGNDCGGIYLYALKLLS
jgi:hypothetical protein